MRAYAAVVNNLGTIVMLPLLAVTAVRSAVESGWRCWVVAGVVAVALLLAASETETRGTQHWLNWRRA